MEQPAVAALRSRSEADFTPRHRRILIASVVIGTTLALAVVVILKETALSVMRGEEVAVVVSPNGRYEAVVYRTTAAIDPVWQVDVRERGGLWADQWTVGCINGDVPQDSFETVTWAKAETLVVKTVEDSARITVNPQSGQPAGSSASIWNWDC